MEISSVVFFHCSLAVQEAAEARRLRQQAERVVAEQGLELEAAGEEQLKLEQAEQAEQVLQGL